MIRVEWLSDVSDMQFDEAAIREVLEEHGENMLLRGTKIAVIDDEDTEVTVCIDGTISMLNAHSNEEPITLMHVRVTNVKLL